jgi:hypothetical protein
MDVKSHTPYEPSTGTEGMAWAEGWCDKCVRRALSPNAKTQCVHELKALSGVKNDKWFYVDGRPVCLAFRARSDRKKYKKKIKNYPNQLSLWV